MNQICPEAEAGEERVDNPYGINPKHNISVLFAERPGDPKKDIKHNLKDLKTLTT